MSKITPEALVGGARNIVRHLLHRPLGGDGRSSVLLDNRQQTPIVTQSPGEPIASTPCTPDQIAAPETQLPPSFSESWNNWLGWSVNHPLSLTYFWGHSVFNPLLEWMKEKRRDGASVCQCVSFPSSVGLEALTLEAALIQAGFTPEQITIRGEDIDPEVVEAARTGIYWFPLYNHSVVVPVGLMENPSYNPYAGRSLRELEPYQQIELRSLQRTASARQRVEMKSKLLLQFPPFTAGNEGHLVDLNADWIRKLRLVFEFDDLPMSTGIHYIKLRVNPLALARLDFRVGNLYHPTADTIDFLHQTDLFCALFLVQDGYTTEQNFTQVFRLAEYLPPGAIFVTDVHGANLGQIPSSWEVKPYDDPNPTDKFGELEKILILRKK